MPVGGRLTARMQSSGFSTVELIVVIVVAGILAAVATARFAGKGGFDSRGYYDQAIAVVRQAQKVAIAQRRDVYVVVTADRIAACYDAACAGRVAAPARLNATGTDAAAHCLNDAGWLCVGRPGGVAALASAPASFFFNALGRPDATATITITGAEAGDIVRQIVVEPETGYVRQA